MSDTQVGGRRQPPRTSESSESLQRVNISERKKPDPALCDSEDRLRLLLDSTAEGIFGIDLEARCTFCNTASLRALGYESADELLGKNMHRLIHHTRPDGTPYPAESCPILKALDHGQGAHIQDEVLWKADGTSFHAECWSNPQLKGDRVVGAVVAFIDISDRQRAIRALEESEERFSKAFQESPLALTITSAKDHWYLDVNHTFERLTGYCRQEAIGRTPFDLGLWIKRSDRLELVERALAEGGIRDIEHQFRMRDGSIRVFLGSMQPIEIEGEQFILSAAVDITDRKRMEQEFYRSASDLKEAQRLAQIGSWTMDLDTGRQTWSDELYNIFGLHPSLPPPSFDEMAPLFKASSWERLKIARRAGNVASLELELIRPDGSRRWIFSQGEVERDGSGRIVRLRGTAQDITERRKAEEALREGEERFRRVIEHIGDALFVDDVDGRVVFANDQFLKLFGFSRDELQNIVLEDYIAPEYRAELRDRHEKRMRGETIPTHFEYEGCRRDGSRMWLEVDVVAIKDHDGKVIGTQSALRDITSRKHAERALRESEERFRTIANSAPVMIWMSGPDRLCTYFNKPWLDFSGRSLEAELGNGWTKGVHPDDLATCVESYTQSFDRREPFKIEYRLKRHDGEYRWIVDIGVPRFNADGSFAGYIGSCADDTERRAGMEALRTVSGRLIQAQEEERKRVARDLHDDINQRLALLAIDLQRLKDGKRLPSSQLQDNLAKLVKQTSDIALDVQAISHQLHSTRLDYLGLVAAIQGYCDDLVRRQKVKIDFVHSDVPASLPADVSLALFRVAQEALHNATKYSGVHTFEVRLLGTPREIQLTVRDSGVGFGPEAAMQGRGLGLIGMRERIVPLNGRISIVSKPKHGTEISVCVPLPTQSTANALNGSLVRNI